MICQIKFVITPKAYEIDTNLTIIDSHNRVYTFYLRSDPKESNIVPHFAVVVDLPDSGFTPAVDNKPALPPIDTAQINKLSVKEYDFLQTLEASGIVNKEYTMFGVKPLFHITCFVCSKKLCHCVY